MEHITFDSETVERVRGQMFTFPEVVLEHTQQLLPENASLEERLQTMRLVRDSLSRELTDRQSCREASRLQFENMTKNVRPDRRPYFVR